MSTLSVRLPESLHHALKHAASEDQTSINQFITMAVGERISALALAKRLDQQASFINRVDYEAVLKKVPNRPGR